MNPRPIPRSRIILAALVPFILLALVGLGLAATMAYKLLRWEKAEATYLGNVPGIFVRGNVADHTISQRHYRFARKDGSQVQLYFLERESGAPPAKSLAVLYDPSVEAQISSSEGSRWDRASSVWLFLFVGLGMTAVGLFACLAGGVLFLCLRGRTGMSTSRLRSRSLL
jgi:hypothetical protein